MLTLKVASKTLALPLIFTGLFIFSPSRGVNTMKFLLTASCFPSQHYPYLNFPVFPFYNPLHHTGNLSGILHLAVRDGEMDISFIKVQVIQQSAK